MKLLSDECLLFARPAPADVFQHRHCNAARNNVIPAAKPNMATA
jgi:hypothetical protein